MLRFNYTSGEARMKIIKTLVLSAALGVTASGAAIAITSGTIAPMSTTGASMNNIAWSFDAWPCGNGCISGFNYSGYLTDSLNDGNAVFVHAQTDGYGYAARIYNSTGNGTTKYVSQKVLDTNSDPAQHATIQVCRDRGTLYPDNCVTSVQLNR
jgi:hypothetical protein